MTHWPDAEHGAYLPAETVLGQIAAAVVVTDRLSSLLYANAFAERLFGFHEDPARLVGQPILTLGFGECGTDLARQVLGGRSWDGTFAAARRDGSHVLVDAQAVPLRHPAGTIEGIVIIAREATRRSSQRERDQMGLLERIGERLAGSLELSMTLRHVAEMLVPHLADHCVIDLFHGEKLMRRVQMNAHGWTPPPGSWARVGDQIDYPEGHFCQQAMARLDAVLVENLRQENPRAPAPTPGSLEAARGVGMTSVIAAPLYARGELLGVMSLATSSLTERAEKHYDADDREFLSIIASRVAIAIDNALLFEEERRTALAFQTSLLPQSLPRFDGIEVAYRYVPAKPLETHGQGIQTQVGGDWYDIIPLSAGRVGIVIGDVEGRGARAAAIMGQLRAALRAFAQDDKPPAEILRKLDDWCRTLVPAKGAADTPDPPIVSCTYLVYDAWSRNLSFANAGHDAPLLITDGEVSELEMEHKGLLLGVRGRGVAGLPTYREETRRLPAGSALVLYTDGLTDRRQRADGTGHYTEAEALEMLQQSVGRVARGHVEAIAQAAEEAVPGDIDDDMAIVVVRTSSVDLAWWECSFPAEPIRVSEARRLAQATFRSWGMDPEQTNLTCLLVSEVVTNVVLHTATPRAPRREFALEAAGVTAAARAAGAAGRAGTAGPAGAVAPVAPSLASGWATGSPGRPARSSRSGCAGGRKRCGSRCSTPTCACPGSAARARPTRGDEGCTWSISWPAGGVPGRPGTARRSGSRCPCTTIRGAAELVSRACWPPTWPARPGRPRQLPQRNAGRSRPARAGAAAGSSRKPPGWR
jgi:PAS domain S-box-containing protein